MSNTFIAESVISHTQHQLDELVAAQRAFFASGATRSYEFRMGQLGVLYRAVKRYEPEIVAALYKDLRKPEFEAFGTEIGPLLKEISYTRKRLRGWMKPQQKGTPLMFFPSTSKILQEPRGNTLIISPWNYPFMLIMSPLVSAIAAGNTAILKPSELAPATEAVLAKIIRETFEPEFVAVVTGPGQWITEALIERHQLGLVFFTGSTGVGRLIMQAAARQLSPVVLELGGKSPCIVAEDASLDYTARKIIFSKFMNAGQTCVASDYILVHAAIKDKLVSKLKAQLPKMFGSDASQSKDYGRIINQRRFSVLSSYLQQGRILYGGDTRSDDLYIGPTLMDEVDPESAIMQEEIFGPILPILTYHSNEEAKGIIERNPHPLALYVFTESSATERYFIDGISFGGGCVNNGLIHLGNPELPFNGVGNSGIGMYHGKQGFLTFSHQKSVMKSSSKIDAPLWYPPYQGWYVKALKKLMR